MKQLSLILILVAWAGAQTPPGATPPTAGPTQTSEQKAAVNESAPPLPVDLENARKAKALLEQAIQALGGDAYLHLHDMQSAGRTYSFHHGQPTSNGIQFWRFTQYPDKDRFEFTKERDVAQVFIGNKGYEITFKGPHPVEEKDLVDYLRRRRFSIDIVLRTWVTDSTVALFYDGNAVAAQHSALQVTLINKQNESVTLYFDVDTHLPIKKTFTWRDPLDKQKNLEEEIYDNYRLVQGIMTPYDVARYFNGDISNQRFLNSVSYNQGLEPAMFDPNSGYNPNRQPSKR